uniref:RAD51 associated protein 1 n=1 Tax=Sphenodon punctatus TaxID=8508 RepID=A0A8D0HT78_SPHPU
MEKKREKREKQKKPHKEETPVLRTTSTKRVSLDDKLYQRDLEVAVALSVKGSSSNNLHVQDSHEQGTEKCDRTETENIDSSHPLSGCSVDSDILSLDQIADENDTSTSDRRQRTVPSKAISQQKKLLRDDRDEDNADNYEPEFVSNEESESDSDFSEEDDEDFSVKKRKTEENKKRETHLKAKVEKKEKKPAKSRANSTVTAVAVAPMEIPAKSQPAVKMTSHSPEPFEKPLKTSSPSTDNRKSKWIPPAASGSSGNPLGGISVKSPTQSLRLGLSRFARVKPLHPSATSS